MSKIRLDRLLVDRGLYPTREKAQAALMAGLVKVNGQRADKAGTPVAPDVTVEVAGPAMPYVSRGGLKLARALDVFGWDVTGLEALDLGASTGGFTDCLLQRGARLVTAVDVGKGQLDWKLRQDQRVTILDKCNARYLQPGDLKGPVDFITADVSFISLDLILPVMPPLLKPEGRIVCLIKPQFEAGREKVRKGVVRDPQVHQEVIGRRWQRAIDLGLELVGLTWSPVRGPAGNLEYLAGFRAKEDKPGPVDEARIESMVEEAHRELPN